jgi:hypothetical protein
MTQQGIVKEKNVSKHGVVWVLGIAVFALIIGIFYQHTKIKNIQGDKTSEVAISQEKTAVKESPANEQETKDKETIKKLQAELKNLKTGQTTEVMSHAKKAVQNPDPKEISNQNISSNDPAATKIYSTDEIKYQTTAYYTPLFRRLGLSQQEKEGFSNLLITRNKEYDNKANEIRAERWTDGNMNIGESSKKLAAIKEEQDALVKEFLGEEKYKRYIQYNNSKGIFDIIDKDAIVSLEESVEAQNQIEEQQRDNLEAAMAEVFQEYISEYAPEVQGAPPYKMEFVSEATTLKMAEHIDELQKEYFDHASSILTKSQMKNYETIIHNKIEKSKNALNKRIQEMKNYKDRY